MFNNLKKIQTYLYSQLYSTPIFQMWQLIKYPFPKIQPLSILPEFDINTPINPNQLHLCKQQIKLPEIEEIDKNTKIKIYEYTLYLFFIKTLEYTIPDKVLKRSFATIIDKQDIAKLVVDGYYFGCFINTLYEQHNHYIITDNRTQQINNYRKALNQLKNDVRIQTNYLFSDQQLIDVNKNTPIFFDLLNDIIQVFYTEQQIQKLKQFTQHLFVQLLNKQKSPDQLQKQVLSDRDFPVYLSKQLQLYQFPVNAPTTMNANFSMLQFLQHYGISNADFNSDPEWRNGYYLYKLIKKIVDKTFILKYKYECTQNKVIEFKRSTSTGNGNNLTESKKNIPLNQIITNLSSIKDKLNQENITQNLSYDGLLAGDTQTYYSIIQSLMKQFPYLKPVYSLYDEREIDKIKKTIIQVLYQANIIQQKPYFIQNLNNQLDFSFLMEFFRSGQLIYDILLMFYEELIIDADIKQYIPMLQKQQKSQMIELVTFTNKYVKFNDLLQYSALQLENASEELAVAYLENLIAYRYICNFVNSKILKEQAEGKSQGQTDMKKKHNLYKTYLNDKNLNKKFIFKFYKQILTQNCDFDANKSINQTKESLRHKNQLQKSLVESQCFGEEINNIHHREQMQNNIFCKQLPSISEDNQVLLQGMDCNLKQLFDFNTLEYDFLQ